VSLSEDGEESSAKVPTTTSRTMLGQLILLTGVRNEGRERNADYRIHDGIVVESRDGVHIYISFIRTQHTFHLRSYGKVATANSLIAQLIVTNSWRFTL